MSKVSNKQIQYFITSNIDGLNHDLQNRDIDVDDVVSITSYVGGDRMVHYVVFYKIIVS